MDLVTGLTLVAATQAVVGGVVVIAAAIPATPRTPAHREEAATTGRLPIIGGNPERPVRNDVIVDVAERTRRTEREQQARVRRGESLRRQVAVLGAAYHDAREQLEAYESATVTAPTPVVLEHRTPGGAR